MGRALQRAADVEFIDIDVAIERAEGMTTGEIFDTLGETVFRQKEAETLQTAALPTSTVKIIACGGGTPCFGQNLDFMLCNGTVVWLEASLPVTLRRIREAGDTRPLLAGKSDYELERFVAEHYAMRIPFYAKAHERFESSHLETPSQIDAAVEQFISRFGLTKR